MKKHIPPLLGILLISALLVAGIGAVLKYGILEPLGILRKEGILEMPFVLLADNELSGEVSLQMENHLNPTEPTVPETEPPIAPVQLCEVVPETEPPTESPTEPTEPAYVPVDAAWFDDALFIGDSRTVGLKHVDSLENADFFCRENMTVFTVEAWRCSDTDFRKKKLEEVLKQGEYGKIFINLGLNECGSDHDKVMTKYQEVLDKIQELEPDAVIILQTIMTVSKAKASDPKFSLERIGALNDRIMAAADGEKIRYIDVNKWIADEDGYLNKELSYDGTHLYGVGYAEWADWIIEEVGWLGIS